MSKRNPKAPGTSRASAEASTEAHPPLARRFVRAPGAPISDEQAQLVGEELIKIATEHKVEDIRMLDKHLVFEIVEKDPHHPLRSCYNWDRDEAARKHWLAHTAMLIRSVRCEVVYGEMKVYEPIFISAVVGVRDGRSVPKRVHVLRDDLLKNDPAFMSAIGFQIRQVKHSLRQLEGLTSARPVPPDIKELVMGLREVMRDYDISLVDRAAE